MRGTPKLYALLASAACMTGYTGKVAYETSTSQQLFKTTHKYRLNFSPGSADEILLDSLKTGDVLLFSRRWYHYHIPQALYILVYQFIFDTEFDHIGICVCDKFGEPSVLENTFFGGLKSRPFNERIVHSKAHQISLIMLEPRDDIPEVENVPAHRSGPRPARSKVVAAEVRNAVLRQDLKGVLSGVNTSSSTSVSAAGATSVSSPGSTGKALASLGSGLVAEVSAMLLGGAGCYNLQLLKAVYDGIGITLQGPSAAEPREVRAAGTAGITGVAGAIGGADREVHKSNNTSYLTCKHLLDNNCLGAVSLVDDAHKLGAVAVRRYFSSRITSVRMK